MWKDASIEVQSIGIRYLMGEDVQEPIFLQEVTLEDLAKAVVGTAVKRYIYESFESHDFLMEQERRRREVVDMWYIGIEDIEYAFLYLLDLVVPLEVAEAMVGSV